MAYDDDELPSTSSELFLRSSLHGKKEFQESKAAQVGSLFRFLLNMLKFGIEKKGTTAVKMDRKDKKEEQERRLQQLRAETEKVHGWATKTRREQETMQTEANRQPQISTDAALQQEVQWEAAKQQGQLERQQQENE